MVSPGNIAAASMILNLAMCVLLTGLYTKLSDHSDRILLVEDQIDYLEDDKELHDARISAVESSVDDIGIETINCEI